MKILNIHIEQTIHQRMHTMLKIDIKRCEQITTLAQGIIVASTASLVLPHPLGLLAAGVSLLTSIVLAFPNFTRLIGDEKTETPVLQDELVTKQTVITSDNDVLYKPSVKKFQKIELVAPLDPRHIASEKRWRSEESSAKSTYWRDRSPSPTHENDVRETVGSRNSYDSYFLEKDTNQKNLAEPSKQIPALRPISRDREPVGAREF